MKYELSPATRRAVGHAAAWLGRDDYSESQGPALLSGLLAQPECRAAMMLARLGTDAAAVAARWPRLSPSEGILKSSLNPAEGMIR